MSPCQLELHEWIVVAARTLCSVPATTPHTAQHDSLGHLHSGTAISVCVQRRRNEELPVPITACQRGGGGLRNTSTRKT
jgi:hypothetical protein